MSASRCLIYLFLAVAPWFCLLANVQEAKAQDSTSSFPSTRDSYDLGLQTGILLSRGIEGIDEIVPGWGFRLSQPLGRNAAEVTTFIGQGHGITYDSLGLDYRIEIPAIDQLFALFHFGIHYDYYKGADQPAGQSFGWHLGGGIMQPLAGPIAFRADFQYRAAPGSSLELVFGLIYRQSSGSGGN